MTIMTADERTSNTPTRTTPAPEQRTRAYHNAAHLARAGQVTSELYWADPVGRMPNGAPAAAMASDIDPDYGRATTDAEIYASVDNQSIAAPGTGPAPISASDRFTRKRRAAGAPKMTLAQVMDLKPFRVVRALAAIIEVDQIHSPYTQLLDLVLTKSARTDAAARAAAEADAVFPEDQMSLDYQSKAEQILSDLARDPSDSLLERDADLLTPELVYTPDGDEYTHTPVTTDEDDHLDQVPGGIEDGDLSGAVTDDQQYDELIEYLLDVDDYDAWLEVTLQGRPHHFVAARTNGNAFSNDAPVGFSELDDQLLYA